MAADNITYTDKVQGQSNPATATKKYTYTDANEVKTVVNAHAANIDELVVDFISGLIPSIEDKEYKLILNIPYAGSISTTSTESVSGTATGTFSIDGTNLGGTVNAISSTEDIQTHSTDNAFIAGQDIELTISANASAVDTKFTITYTRTLA